MALIVKIPADPSQPATQQTIPPSSTTTNLQRGDLLPTHLQQNIHPTQPIHVDTTVLLRHYDEPTIPGLYAYTISRITDNEKDDDDDAVPNLRATRLAMACGLHSQRFTGDVYVSSWGYTSSGFANIDVSLADIEMALYSPDLRIKHLKEIMSMDRDGEDEEGANVVVVVVSVPEWLGAASQRNYHDGASIMALAVAMTRRETIEDEDDEDEEDSDSLYSSPSDAERDVPPPKSNPIPNATRVVRPAEDSPTIPELPKHVTLCLHCRRPATTLCTGCQGAYFCDEPRRCKIDGWSHQCLCPTWKLYVQHRRRLSHFAYFSGWHLPLLGEECYRSDDAYKLFLMETLHVIDDKREDAATTPATPTRPTRTQTNASWWNTEIHGWNGGRGTSAKRIDLYQRTSFREGLRLDDSLIPDETHVSPDDIQRAGISTNRENHSMPILSSWEEYYRVRSLPPSSPVALLATFPLTVYYAIQRHGMVPIAVSQMLDRPMKVHVVGIEKELNFVDFFREVGFLLPEEVSVDMTWVVREDMFPDGAANGREERETVQSPTLLSLRLTSNLSLSVIAGTYGDSLDPNFDIIGGAPDMVIGLNAGLYAYESWRHVVSYLYRNPSVVGVFTDYNEHSGMNCASLGGGRARNSLEINPFRQPRAMPVNCMNLPQMSNGFMYVFNEQALE